ncbi:geranylgeranyl reductase family protein [Dactylosporangium roseum]|uniref:Geranylgeranyl reductase family protein n=1 Tax=Dactylosporangium roseum TaxID=47989 RepID=A0ABY5Z1U9_9ACTN|nr:geranylgeranyl reductase family protein [Dactylosporangium roseum]UWZ35629.1 geranylgeranyl reductase family protein [Dactylosporangium roseum]
MDEFDVVVIGAGPAGASAALAARRGGASVLLLDKAGFPRDKPCGDGIAPHALDVVRGLGVTGLEEGFAPVPVLRLTGPGGGTVARPHRRPAYTIPRLVFDNRLVEAAAAAGAVVRRHAVRRLEERAGGVVVDGVIGARTVVGADGAYSSVRKALGQPANGPGHLALAIRGYATAPVGEPEQRIVTAAARWPAYAWSFPIGDGRANIGYGEVLRGSPLSRAHLLDRLAALLPDLDVAGATDLRAHHLPLSTRRPLPARGRLLLAGDALSLINPFTGEGIFYAVLSGALAGAAAVHTDAPARRYLASLRRRLGRHLRHSRAAALLGGRRWIVDAAVRAAAGDQRVFDTLVELGLGDGRLTPRTIGAIARHAARR